MFYVIYREAANQAELFGQDGPPRWHATDHIFESQAAAETYAASLARGFEPTILTEAIEERTAK